MELTVEELARRRGAYGIDGGFEALVALGVVPVAVGLARWRG